MGSCHQIQERDTQSNQVCGIYDLSQNESQQFYKFLFDQLNKGYIRPSKLQYTSPFFFVKRKDRKLCLVQNYRAILEYTICNNYPLPLIQTLIQDLSGAHIYTKLDVHWGYNNVCIREGDKHKAAFKTP